VPERRGIFVGAQHAAPQRGKASNVECGGLACLPQASRRFCNRGFKVSVKFI